MQKYVNYDLESYVSSCSNTAQFLSQLLLEGTLQAEPSRQLQWTQVYIMIACTLYETLCSIYESCDKAATHPSLIVCSQLVGSSMFAVAISVKTERDDN